MLRLEMLFSIEEGWRTADLFRKLPPARRAGPPRDAMRQASSSPENWESPQSSVPSTISVSPFFFLIFYFGCDSLAGKSAAALRSMRRNQV